MFTPTNSFYPGTLGDININTTPGGVIRTSGGQTTLDKIFATALQSLALLRGSPYVPTEEVPAGLYQQQQQQYPIQYQQNPYIPPTNGTGATFGASLESFVTNNTGLILIGVVAIVLFQSGRK